MWAFKLVKPYNFFLKNSNNPYPISPAIIAIPKFAIVTTSPTAHISPLVRPAPDLSNSPISKFA
jgi:hypothetical protein